ncbi:SBBP repeat-containing protein [Dyadobacter endophyticus]|uniref:SBBP repeat-containing protein n=1 Tax=Dyadobacter TaxID=120831 RepID=UPI003CEC7413
MKRFFIYILIASIAIACHIETPERPLARFTYTPEGGCTYPCEITFTSESLNAANMRWDFGDDTPMASGQSVTHKFQAAGTYQVKLTAKGVDGGSSGSTQAVHIDHVKPFSLSGDKNIPTDIVSDNDGNIYVSGTAAGRVEFGNGHVLQSKGGDDFFVAKFDSTGVCLWLYTDGSPKDDHGNAIALDKENNVYLTGFIGGEVSAWNNSYKGGEDGFVTKIKANGARDWVKTFGGPASDQGRSLAFYHAGEGPKLYLIGRVQGDLSTENIDFNRPLPLKANGHDGFLVLVNADTGAFDEPMMIDGDDIQIPEAIAVDLDGNAYVTGFFLKTVSFPSPLKPLAAVNVIDAFVAKWSPINGFQWLRRIGSGGNDFAYDIEVDRSGNVFVTGMHSGTLEEFPLSSKGDDNVYLLKWDADGKIQNGSNGFIDDNKDYHGGIALTSTGNIVLGGSFANSAQFPMLRGKALSSLGSTDIIITELDPNSLDRASSFIAKAGGTLEDRLNKICVTKSGYVYAAGWFHGVASFKAFQLESKPDIKNTFIVRYKL